MNAQKTVTTLGWVWVGLAILMFVSGIGGFLLSSLTGAPTGALPVRSDFHDFMWQHYREGTAIQAVVAVFILFTAFRFLQRRPWARVAIQCLAAALLAWGIFFGIYWLRGVWNFTSGSSSQASLLLLRIVMFAGGICAICLISAVFGGVIWLLNRPGIREEFRRDSSC